MRVLILSPTPDKLRPIIEATGDVIIGTSQDGFVMQGFPDLAISYNHPTIIQPAQLGLFPHINLHISLLPYNRGADPNFWSWFDHTPKGVTIHYMDEGIDTGPIIAQRECTFGDGYTLSSTYKCLQYTMLALFTEVWPRLRALPQNTTQHDVEGSYHRRSDLHPKLFGLLPQGWDTPVSIVEEMGASAHAGASFWRKYDQEIRAQRDLEIDEMRKAGIGSKG